MACVDTEKIYSYAASNGATYYYRFSEPIIRNQDREFFGIAKVWKEGSEKDYFNISVHENKFNVNQKTDDAGKAIEFHISQIG